MQIIRALCVLFMALCFVINLGMLLRPFVFLMQVIISKELKMKIIKKLDTTLIKGERFAGYFICGRVFFYRSLSRFHFIIEYLKM